MNDPEPCLCGDPCCRRCFPGGCDCEECVARRPPDDDDRDDWRDA